MEGYMVGKRIVILGSGDIGLIMARRLTLEGAEVHAVIELMPFSGGLVRNIVQCLDDYEIPLYLSHTVTEIKGKNRIESITVAQVDENRRPIPGTEMEFECDTLLLSVGLIPENELSKSAGIKLDPVTGGPIVNESMETSIKGIFACGNVVHVHDLVDFVTEESRRAGRSAANYVKNQLKHEDNTIPTKPGKGVRYIVPQSVTVDNLDNSLELFMRVDNIYKDKKLVVKMDNHVLKTINKKRLTPGEMEHIQIDFKDIKKKDTSFITVEVEGI
jgi:pyruvate/2-oxoglutarate dehydrogenase complex dihydrolipoamide dehydrogenase (E3) component